MTRKSVVNWILLIEFLWIFIWVLLYTLEGELVFDFFLFITVFNVFTVVPLIFITRRKASEEHILDRISNDSSERTNRDTWQQTVIGYYILVNGLLMVFMGWVTLMVEDLL